MKDFIAKLGYILCWGIGTPKQTLEENYIGFYKIGMFFINICELIFIFTIIALIILFVYMKRKGVKNEIQ